MNVKRDVQDFARERDLMVKKLEAMGIIKNSRILQSMRVIPKHKFASLDRQVDTYMDVPLPTAVMVDSMKLKDTDKVLEIGADDCGYCAAVKSFSAKKGIRHVKRDLKLLFKIAHFMRFGGIDSIPFSPENDLVLSRICKQVMVVEYERTFGNRTISNLKAAECNSNVHVIIGDASVEIAENAPYDAILITATSKEPPKLTKQQLKVGGRMVVLVEQEDQEDRLIRVTRLSEDKYSEEQLDESRFVPLMMGEK